MAQDVEFAVTATDKTGAALAAAEAKFKATQDRLGKDSAKIGDGLKNASETGVSSIGRLRKELEVAEGDLKKLGEAYANAGSAAERIDITKQIRKQKSEISSLKGVIKSLDGDVEDAVDKAAPSIISKIKTSFGEAGASGGQLLALGLVATAPLIGATISAAVIGGAGAGGVLGGVLLASRDPRVAAAGAALGQNLLGDLQKDAAPFVEPTLQGINKIEGAIKGMNGEISHIFSKSSSFLAPLEDGVIGAVSGILHGVDALVSKGEPVIDQLGSSFNEFGQATGKSLEVISGGAGNAAKGLKDLTDATSGTIVGVGYLVRGLTELYGAVTVLPHIWVDAGEKLFGLNDAVKNTGITSYAAGTAQAVLAQNTLSAGEAAGKAGLDMQTYTEKMGAAAQVGHALYDSQTAVAQSLADAHKALKENGKTLDLNTQKGRDNRRVLSQTASSLLAVYSAYVTVNGEGAGAAKIADNNRQSFIRLARQFGLTKGQAADLATQMGLLPAKKKTDFYANTHDAAGRIAALQGQVNSLHGKTIGVHVSVTGTERLNSLGHRIGGFASAGDYFSLVDRGRSGTSRTGGPTPVNVTSQVAVNLDGQPFYNMTVSAVDSSARRQAWRAKVGAR